MQQPCGGPLNIIPAPLIFYSMTVYRPLRAGLCIYECIRLGFLLAAFTALRPGEGTAFPWLTYGASNALFPLMALFLLLDNARYAGYAPLYAAGKCVSFFATIGWCVISRQHLLAAALRDNTFLFVAPGILGILLFGDMLSVAAGLIIGRKTRSPVFGDRPAAVIAGADKT